jgi:DNA-binding response OmpR family regulator
LKKKKILIIDDDTELNSLLCEYLEQCNFETTTKETPYDGLNKLKNMHFDLIILDVMLPLMDGFETLKQIRKDYETPVIMLTAKGDVIDKILGLELGADDYVPKPFQPRELIARIQSVLRRSEMKITVNETITLKNLVIDPNDRSVLYYGKDMKLTTTEYDLLLYFVKHTGKVLTRDEIMQNIRGISWMSFDRSVDVLVSRLRFKFKALGNKKEHVIKSIHSVGYLFCIGDEDK